MLDKSTFNLYNTDGVEFLTAVTGRQFVRTVDSCKYMRFMYGLPTYSLVASLGAPVRGFIDEFVEL